MHVEGTTTIDRPREEVFEYISTPENDPTWVSAFLRHERKTPGPVRVGTTTEEDVRFLGRTARYTWEVTEYEPPTAVAYRATSGLLPGAIIRFRLEPVQEGTRLRHAIEFELRGWYYGALYAVGGTAAYRWHASRAQEPARGKTATPSRRHPVAVSCRVP